ncbi:MAG: restriction endonuclease subunit S [Paludibacteraceae bacterium]|nr:restriction endonuclease subunit S [Paludibacteraceae bacterium]
MKQNWEYKKLGEVCEIVGGSTPKTNVEEYWGGSNLWITPAELKGEKYIANTERHLTDFAIQKNKLQLLPIGTVLLSSRAPIGKVAITSVPMYCNQGFKNVICGHLLNNEFVYWYLVSKNDYLNSLGVGATFKEISKKIVEKISIPVPPLSTQTAIVSELDALSAIIADHKSLLKKYDELEQSIFYDMFGDPVKNEKGWEVKKLGEVCTLSQGLAINSQTKKLLVEKSSIPLLRIKDMKEGTREIFVDDMNYPESCLAKPDELIYTRTGTLGLIFTGMYGIVHNNCFKIKIKEEIADKTYFMFYVSLNSFRDSIISKASRSSQPDITHKLFNSQTIFLPPLPLQQEFASKIKAIEAMKADTKKSLAKSEELFNARMDYYFNA